MVKAAALLGVSDKTLQRWRKRTGAPFAKDGSVILDELRAWAQREGLLGRGRGRPSVIDELTAGAAASAPAPATQAAPTEDPAAAVAAVARAFSPDPTSPLAQLTPDDRATLEALVAGDARALIDLAHKVDPALLKRLAAMGRTQRELAEGARRELENAEKRGELVKGEDVKRSWRAQIQIVKSHFQMLPGKLAPRLVDKGYDEIYKALDEELDALLRVFAVEVPA